MSKEDFNCLRHKEIMHYAQGKLRRTITKAIEEFQLFIEENSHSEVTANVNVDISYIRGHI